MDQAFFIGADIGGSHISIAAIDQASLQIIGDTFRSKINTEIDATNFIQVLVSLIKQCSTSLQEKKIAAICLAFPGAFDYENGIGLYDGSNKKFEKLYGLNIRETLATELQTDIPIFFCNDALSFSLGEYEQLHNASINMMAITLGSGLGSSFIKNYQLLSLTDNSIPNNGELYNWPYKAGVAEDYFSSKALLRQYSERTGIQADGVKTIKEHADNQDPEAIKLFADFGKDLGIFLLHWSNQSGIKAIVIGGSIVGAWDYFYPSLKQAFSNEQNDCSIIPSKNPEQSSMLGSVVAYLHKP
ncbi:MAG: ROK family protein [Sphingobacteriia bacterium]|jgi:glucokinase